MLTALFKLIGRVFGFLWRTLDLSRRVLTNLVFVLIIAALLVATFWRPEPSLPERAALVLRPSGNLVEGRTLQDPFSVFRLGRSPVVETTLADLIEAVEAARTDARIAALVLETDELAGGGLSKLAELRQAIERFKESGKPVYARGERFAQSQYYLASVADDIDLAPDGFVLLSGFARYITFYKEALDQLGVRINVFRVGEYKSFSEPFTRTSMSEEDRASTLDLLEGLWGHFRSEVIESRALSETAFDAWVNRFPELLRNSGGDAAAAALQHGLVDQLSHRDVWQTRLRETVGADEDGKGFSRIGVQRYLAHQRKSRGVVSDKVAVLVAQGAIVDGIGTPGSIGGDSFASLIRQAREDESVKALVVRIDSPGGSAWASEVIRRELELTRQAGKPVLASMSSVAASGGYWIAAGADEIWAHPATVTGSIGVFAMFPELAEPMNRLGLSVDGVSTGPLAGALDPRRPLDPAAADALQQSVEHTYQRFLSLVGEARKMPAREVDLLARGRIWTGESAEKLGLVDHLGGLEDAVAAAAARANLLAYDLVWPSIGLSPRDLLMQRLGEFIGLGPVPATHLGAAGVLQSHFEEAVSALTRWNDPRHLYAHCQCESP